MKLIKATYLTYKVHTLTLQAKLKTVEASLSEASNLIGRQNQSLRELSSEIKNQQRKARLSQIKSFLYGGLAMYIYKEVK